MTTVPPFKLHYSSTSLLSLSLSLTLHIIHTPVCFFTSLFCCDTLPSSHDQRSYMTHTTPDTFERALQDATDLLRISDAKNVLNDQRIHAFHIVRFAREAQIGIDRADYPEGRNRFSVRSSTVYDNNARPSFVNARGCEGRFGFLFRHWSPASGPMGFGIPDRIDDRWLTGPSGQFCTIQRKDHHVMPVREEDVWNRVYVKPRWCLTSRERKSEKAGMMTLNVGGRMRTKILGKRQMTEREREREREGN
jgi:hypothetical protein